MRHALICALLMLVSTRPAVGQAGSSSPAWKTVSELPSRGSRGCRVRRILHTGYTLPAKVYSVTSGPQRFALTVVDFRGIQQQAIAKVCPKGP